MRMKMSQKQLFECSGDILKHHCSFPISLFQICILIKIISVHQVQLFTINQIYNELSDLEANSSAAGWSLAWHRHELTSEGPWCQGLTWTPGGGWSDSTRGQAETLVISVHKSHLGFLLQEEFRGKHYF